MWSRRFAAGGYDPGHSSCGPRRPSARASTNGHVRCTTKRRLTAPDRPSRGYAAREFASAAAPPDPRPHLALAALLVNAGRHREALGTYRELLGLDLPSRTRSAVRRGLALLERELADSRQ
jgi:hypothetical protein